MSLFARQVAGVGCCLAMAVPGVSAQRPAQAALSHALNGAAAAGVVLDAATGNMLARAGDIDTPATPGSTLKPFVLLAALEHGAVGPQTTLECRGTLTLAGRNLACTHPAALRTFTAESALAYSCNAYFATVARRMNGDVLTSSLQSFGLRPTLRGTGASPEGRVLLALGLAGIEVSPKQLALAYRRLTEEMQLEEMSAPRKAALQLVERGLEGSASYGMANNAATKGVRLAGKTGTASEPGQAWTHGWFAGIVYEAERPKEIMVMYVSRGSGADAALLAHRFLLAERGR